LQDRPGVRQIAADRVSRLPWLAPPAGYVVLIKDVAYGNRYKIARHQQLDRHQIERGADFPFQTRVVLILEAENAAEAERDLHDELAAGKAIGDWFDLDQFPKTPPAQTIPPVPRPPQESVSLRDLVENDDGADSLLQEANIVGARSRPSISRRPSRNMQHTARRRRPKFARWVFVLGLIVLVGVLVAEYSSDIGRVIESLLDERRQQSASPTPTVEGRGEVFFTSTRAYLRTCAAVSCRAFDVLNPGTRITANKYVQGERVIGSKRWIQFLHQGELRYLHESELSRTWPVVEPTPEPSPTPAIEGRGEVFYTKTRSRVRTCANISCQTVAILNSGSKITARRFVSGQQVNGSARWIAFLHSGELRYIHDSLLSRTWPLVEPTTTRTSSASPTPIEEGRGQVFFTDTRGRVRSCANTTCRTVEILDRGAKITARRLVTGQYIIGSDQWIEFFHRGQVRYIHSSALSATRPAIGLAPTATTNSRRLPAVREGDILYVAENTWAYDCASYNCDMVLSLQPGTRISAYRAETHGLVDPKSRWVEFVSEGLLRYVNLAKLSLKPPVISQTSEPSPTPKPTRIKATAVGQGEVFYVRSRANARHCARLSCQVLEVLPPGTKITALRFIQGQEIDSNDLWIRFSYNSRHLSIHSGKLTRSVPTAASSRATASSDSTSITASMGTIYYLKIRARARTCPRQTCDVAATLPIGTQITAKGYISGQTVNGNDRWVSFDYNGRSLYILMSLLSRHRPLDAPDAQPSPTAQLTQRNQSSMADATPLYVIDRATVYKCVNTRCQAIDVLERGTKIIPSSYWYGQRINDSNKWIRLRHEDQTVYLHSSYVTEDEPVFEPTADPLPTRKPLRDEYKAVAAGQIYTVKSGETAKVRNCASSNCVEVGTLLPGTKVQAERVTRGQALDGSNEWIMFYFEGWHHFVHSGDLVPSKQLLDPTASATDLPTETAAPPTVTLTATEPPLTDLPTATDPPAPTATATVAFAPKYVVETVGNQNAHIRSCPSTTCDIVAKFAPGTEVDVIESVRGETVYETDVWLEIGFEGGSAFIHSELVAEAG